MNQLVICALLTWALAGFVPSRPRPPISDGPNRVSEGGRNSSRHIAATLQTQMIDLENNSDTYPSDSSRSMGGWQREGLAGFGAGTVYMLDRPSRRTSSTVIELTSSSGNRDAEAKDIPHFRYRIIYDACGP